VSDNETAVMLKKKMNSAESMKQVPLLPEEEGWKYREQFASLSTARHMVKSTKALKPRKASHKENSGGLSTELRGNSRAGKC